MTITSPHNEQLKEVRKLAGRKWRDKLRLFVAEGEDLIEAAARAGWAPEALYAADGSGLEGVPVAPHVLATVSQLGSGTRALGVYGQRWAEAPTGPVCLALWGVNDPGNVGTASRSAPAARTRTARRPCARRWARSSRCPSPASAPWPSSRAARSRSPPTGGQILQSSKPETGMLECKI